LTFATMRSSLIAGLLLAADMSMVFTAFKLTSVVDVTVIGAMQPVIVLIASRPLFGERMSRMDLAFTSLAMVGIAIAVLGSKGGGHHDIDGDLLAVGGLFCWSAYWLISKHARRKHPALEYTTCVTIVAATAVTPVAILSGQSLSHVASLDWLWMSLLAIVPGSGNLIMNWAHRFIDASLSSVIVCLSPLVAALAAKIFLGQTLTLVQFAGVLVGLFSIAVVAAGHRGPDWSQSANPT
jgi:drug/metabolite transporter (DMT)-like permease